MTTGPGPMHGGGDVGAASWLWKERLDRIWVQRRRRC